MNEKDFLRREKLKKYTFLFIIVVLFIFMLVVIHVGLNNKKYSIIQTSCSLDLAHQLYDCQKELKQCQKNP